MFELIRDIKDMKRRSSALRDEGTGVAFVPTMGYLHEGHLALIRKAAELRPFVVVSIFVNPAQFGPSEDFERYPRDIERDCRLVGEAGGDLVFAPAAADIYPNGYDTYVEVENRSRYLCGASRPGHFRGVATIVLKLFNIVRPDLAVFGEKDYQQLVIIKGLVRDLDLDIDIIGHPIVREADGLAMSSRNKYLSPAERVRALCLYNALQEGSRLHGEGERDAGRIRRAMAEIIEKTGGTVVDYASVVDPDTLEDIETIRDGALLALAVRVGETRLIDNLLLPGPGATR